MKPKRPTPEVESFYRLARTELSREPCRGAACFAARQRDPARWREAEAREPRVYCLGQCFAAPAAAGERARPAMEVHARRPVLMRWLDRGGGGPPYEALRLALRKPREEIVGMIERSGLRGRGGAGFPTGRKWRAVFQQPPGDKRVIVNADEGDPGAFSDRFLIEEDPHGVIEGMLIAGYAVGARKGVVYLRKEYPRALEVLRRALEDARRDGFLGDNILGESFSFDADVVLGEGSYVCGEETALIKSVEGARPMVMSRPPYPTERGLFGAPTLIDNVETLANVPWIALNGDRDYQALGLPGSRGTKLVSLNSLFRRPGLYEVEFGVTVRRIVEEIGGGLKTGRLKGLLVGGPLAGVLPPSLLDTPFGFDELRAAGAGVGHGGIVAFDESTSAAELIRHVFSFAAYESCGKCTPCRVGSGVVERAFAGILRGNGPACAAEWREIVAALAQTSLCGLGGGLGEFAASMERHYGEELASCLR